MDLDAAKNAVANGAPAANVSFKTACDEFMAKEENDKDVEQHSLQ